MSSFQNTIEARNALAAATWTLRKCRNRYQGDPINRAATLDAQAKYRAALKAMHAWSQPMISGQGKSESRFVILSVQEKSGRVFEFPMASEPHHEATVMLGKLTRYSWRRLQLHDASQPVPEFLPRTSEL